MSDRQKNISENHKNISNHNVNEQRQKNLETRSSNYIELAVRSLIERLRSSCPRVHALTNTVTASIVANSILSLGATPALSDAQEEIKIAVANSDSLMVNLGTPNKDRIQAIKLASSVARENNIPWLLDPVMVESFPSRLLLAIEVLSNKPSVIRGNYSEIQALCAYFSSDSNNHEKNASYLATRTNSVVVSTGAIDFIADGNSVMSFDIGNPIQQRVAGIGCAMSSIISVLLSISEDPLSPCVGGVLISGEAASIASQKANGPGTFPDLWLDAIYHITHINDINPITKLISDTRS